MRKLLLLGLTIILFTACETKPEQFTTTSSNIDEVKALIADYEAGNWDGWTSHYADTAKIYHNTWETGSTPAETQEALKSILANTSSYAFEKGEDNIVFEQVIDDEDETWVNFWGEWKGKLKANDQEIVIPVHLSLLMVNGKIAREYGFYDVSTFQATLQEIEKANNMPVEEKAIAAAVDKLVNEFHNKKNTAILSEFLDDNYIRYMNDVKIVSNPKELADAMNVFFTGFPDFHIKLLHKSPVFNNTQFLHWEMTGTNTGEFDGTPATGKKVKVTGLSRVHFNGEGKMDEENVFYDQLALMQQLGRTIN